ncbi:MAG: hypothetical protein IPF41_06825 [Flavobacteriales bacterium]|nr:hypothetical protein [Flavobacteriales bacterium]
MADDAKARTIAKLKLRMGSGALVAPSLAKQWGSTKSTPDGYQRNLKRSASVLRAHHAKCCTEDPLVQISGSSSRLVSIATVVNTTSLQVVEKQMSGANEVDHGPDLTEVRIAHDHSQDATLA